MKTSLALTMLSALGGMTNDISDMAKPKRERPVRSKPKAKRTIGKRTKSLKERSRRQKAKK